MKLMESRFTSLILLSLSPLVMAADAPSGPGRDDLLERGEILGVVEKIPDSSALYVRIEGKVDAPVDEVFAILSGAEHQSRISEHLKQNRPVSAEAALAILASSRDDDDKEELLEALPQGQNRLNGEQYYFRKLRLPFPLANR